MSIPPARRQIGAAAIAVALALGGIAGGPAPSAGASDAPIAASASARAENAFALALLPRVAGSGNVVYSPYSIDTALTMADAGAKGKTATQIDRLLGAASPGMAAANAAALRSAVGSDVSDGTPDAPTLEVANALWTQQGVALQSPFVTTLTGAFGAPPQAADFADAPETARQTINAWVAAQTANLIPNLLPQGSIGTATVVVLANAIYLKANWAAPFDAGLTHPAPFRTATGQRVSAQFMTADGADFAYASSAHYEAVDLPYLSSSLSLLAILPTGESLTQFETTLSAESLAALVRSLHTRSVKLRMPKIHLHTQTSLNGPLEALGMTAAFGPLANFSGITTDMSLQISLVEHAADLMVDEQGTVAAAATGINGIALSAPGPATATVNLDHPYLLLLRDDASGAILFVARVANPDAS